MTDTSYTPTEEIKGERNTMDLNDIIIEHLKGTDMEEMWAVSKNGAIRVGEYGIGSPINDAVERLTQIYTTDPITLIYNHTCRDKVPGSDDKYVAGIIRKELESQAFALGEVICVIGEQTYALLAPQADLIIKGDGWFKLDTPVPADPMVEPEEDNRGFNDDEESVLDDLATSRLDFGDLPRDYDDDLDINHHLRALQNIVYRKAAKRRLGE